MKIKLIIKSLILVSCLSLLHDNHTKRISGINSGDIVCNSEKIKLLRKNIF